MPRQTWHSNSLARPSSLHPQFQRPVPMGPHTITSDPAGRALQVRVRCARAPLDPLAQHSTCPLAPFARADTEGRRSPRSQLSARIVPLALRVAPLARALPAAKAQHAPLALRILMKARCVATYVVRLFDVDRATVAATVSPSPPPSPTHPRLHSTRTASIYNTRSKQSAVVRGSPKFRGAPQKP